MSEATKKSGQRYNNYRMNIAWLEVVRKHKATIKRANINEHGPRDPTREQQQQEQKQKQSTEDMTVGPASSTRARGKKDTSLRLMTKE